MEGFNPKKRYNQFRPARRGRNKFAVPREINTDEATGRQYKLEKFLKDCVRYLPSQEVEPADIEPGIEDEPEVKTPKPKRPRHIKLPVLNECKGIFENVVIGRSAKKGGNLGIGSTPEDRARLKEDIHALAKVGPDSEVSFEIIPPTQQRLEGNVRGNEPSTGNSPPKGSAPPREPEETPAMGVVIAPSSPKEHNFVEDGNSPSVHGADAIQSECNQTREFQEAANQPSQENYVTGGEKTVPAEGGNPSSPIAEFYDAEMRETYDLTDSGFKGSKSPPTLRKGDETPGNHWDSRKTAPGGKRGFFDTETILMSTEPGWKDLGINEVFGNPGEGWGVDGGPSNFLGSTYPPPGHPEVGFKGIEIQSGGRETDFLANQGVDYCGSRRPAVSLKYRHRRIDPNKTALTNTRNDPVASPRSSDTALRHLSPYNKYRYDRSLSPRKY